MNWRPRASSSSEVWSVDEGERLARGCRSQRSAGGALIWGAARDLAHATDEFGALRKKSCWRGDVGCSCANRWQTLGSWENRRGEGSELWRLDFAVQRVRRWSSGEMRSVEGTAEGEIEIVGHGEHAIAARLRPPRGAAVHAPRNLFLGIDFEIFWDRKSRSRLVGG